MSARRPYHGFIGVAILLLAEMLMLAGIRPFDAWFYSLAWWPYIFIVDQAVYSLKGESLWVSRRRLYYRYHSPAVNALARPMVQFGLRQRIRDNHRASQRGQLAPDQRAALNLALNEAVHAWQGRRPPRWEAPPAG